MATTSALTAPAHYPVNGKRIEFRWEQMLAWSVAAGIAGACLVAGVYFLVLQVDWHVHIGAVKFQVVNLKPWWDGGMGLFHSGN
jgi:hypothetical protein